MVPQAIETARFNFVVPVLGLPIAIPVEVRTGSDYGLRFRVSEITQAIPLKSADLTFWGMPALAEHDEERFPKGSVAEAAPGCAGSRRHELHRRPGRRRPRAETDDRQPDPLHRRRPGHRR